MSGASGARDWWPGSTRASLHLALLTQLAITQPIFDLLAKHPEFLVAGRARPLDVLTFTLILAVALPAAVAAPVALLARAWPRLAAGLHLGALGALATAVALPVLRGLPAPAQAALAAVVGIAAALLYRRYAATRSFLSMLTPALAIVPAVFLLSAGVRQLAFPTALESIRADAVISRAPVVMVVFDELSMPNLLAADGAIDGARFPGFAALAERATWYRHATTVADSTSYAIPALLTGNYPDRNRIPTASGYPFNLFTLLSGHYRFRVFETLTELCPPELCGPGDSTGSLAARLRSLLADSSVVYLHATMPAAWIADLPSLSGRWRRFRRDEVTADQAALFDRFLDAVRGAEDRTLYFLHVMLPHAPWRYLPSGRRYGCGRDVPPGLDRGRWRDDEQLRLQALQRHLLQVAFADRLLGQLLAALEETGLDQRALLIVTADHGLSFMPGQHWRLISPANARSIASVPLFVRLPGDDSGAGRTVDRPVELIDVVPTMLEALGVRPPPSWSTDGRSLLAPDPAPREHLVVHKTSHIIGRRFELPAGALHAADEGIRELLDRLGPGIDGLFRIDDPLVGRRLAALASLTDPRATVQIDNRDMTSCVFGSVLPQKGDDQVPVAIAVDGTVRAVTRTFRDRYGRRRFYAMVPEDTFEAGGDRVQAVVLTANAINPARR